MMKSNDSVVGNTKNRLILLTVGRLHPVKDHEFLIRACAELKLKELPFLCIIIGEGETRKEVTNLINRVNLQHEVKLLGIVDRPFINAFYQMADLFVLTSKSEGLPLTLMEAMLNERLVLAPNITGIPEIIKDGHNGFLYESGNLVDFVNKVLYIFEKYESTRHIGKLARSHILERFNRKRNMEAFAGKLADLLKSRIRVDEKS